MNPIHDHIVIGAGSAGCVLAARLSEDPSRRVLLVEAGGQDRGLHVRMPAAFTKLFKTERDWNYDTAPEAALAGRELYWPRARMLGGCSSMNAQMYVRGNAADYDAWERLGLPGWGFAGVLPYFLRAEGYARPRPGLLGGDGPLRIEALRDPHVTTAAFLRAAAEVGIPTIDDVNGPTQDGAAHIHVNQRRGQRWSAADAYLRPALGRPNLHVLTGGQVTRVIFAGRRAIGVELARAGGREVFSAGEVVLAAGATNSPQLLLLSGVGPAGHLRAHGVPVVHDAPGVGGNLQDHLAVSTIAACREPVTMAGAESLGNLLRFLVLRRGMLTSNVGEACAFLRSRPGLAAPDLELIFAPLAFVGHGLTPVREHALTVGAVLLQPKSRGTVRLRSGNPLDRPVLTPGYLGDAGGEDLRTLVAGVERAREVLRAPALSRWVGAELQPGPGVAVEDCIRARAETLYHPVGTCRMGGDDASVVDPSLCVRGVEGLRVVDASVMPTIIRGHTHAPTVMIAEKAADLMRGVAAERPRGLLVDRAAGEEVVELVRAQLG